MIYELKNIEFNVFDQSFMLIQKYLNNYQGLRRKYKEVHKYANSNIETNRLRWNTVFSKHKNSGEELVYL
jgi:hypothetical protein